MTRRVTEAAVIETLIKHLPPSASTLRLLDLDGSTGEVLAAHRADLAVTVGEALLDTPAAEDSFDAVVAYAAPLDDDLLRRLLSALRPGGRLISLDPNGDASAARVQTLEAAGYTRILVEEILPSGVLMRGEKPHTTADTLARVQSVARQDAAGEWKGRYVHLLVRQTPNKPAWALKPGEAVEWHALALTGKFEFAENSELGSDMETDAANPVLLAFTSLPNAVAFMQPAVLSGAIKDVNKVARFARVTPAVQGWKLLMNPPISALDGRAVTLIPIDPALAEAPDE